MRALFRDQVKDESYSINTIEVPVPDGYSVIIKVKSCAFSRIVHLPAANSLIKGDIAPFIAAREISGIITVIGVDVTEFSVGDSVVGVIPVSSYLAGCAEYCMMNSYDIVKKPEILSDDVAAAGIGDCITAYTALHYLAHIKPGDTVLIQDGASTAGYMMIQLTHAWGAKVIATVYGNNEYAFLNRHLSYNVHVIEVNEKMKMLYSRVMEETGKKGVDCVIDHEAKITDTESDENEEFLSHKHDIISCLGVNSRWITSQANLQLDPPDSTQLFLRGATVGFLFDPIWTLTRSQHGRYQHILKDAVDKLAQGLIKPKITKVITLDEVPETLQNMHESKIGKIVVKIS